ncbi:sugar kinase [Massilia sp. WF1]|uniref:bifunctional ADP-dependent NAD(P)H-hydrate dehydratase/NAD(P)H-hydrate epimerase n=1 Tax=unclassified Massilia TaxID=2609279 RepID=UPI00064AC254|nr:MULTISPECIES: bifunctional ADP-dependent NAD(P)H-hydrate dehydratase/NAD(P)H-hydrate epimerase [unclassified Massilia]ALK97259.1 bifunctional ADP-dependent (S)-NAD(P)H-hydrate dehydratase/NAD(P)H-hydrate epimerase [Massilia sp. WG5]KLU36439.1 sugar kinase [Massilia sp. WF1]
MDTLLYSCDQIRAIERAAQARLTPGDLMERAGQAATAFALELLDGDAAGAVLVLAGPGNNGGDGLELAASLARRGADVEVLHLAGERAPSFEAGRALQRARDAGARFVDEIPAGRPWRLVVDALFGIGLARPLAGRARELALWTAGCDCPVLALDVPSGLEADSGAIVGADGAAVTATHTITFLGNKPGLHTGDGCDRAGEVRVDMLGADGLHQETAQAVLNGPALFAERLAPRRRNSHKGSFGDVAVLGGARGMAGAAVLAARAALYGGAGRVFAALLDGGMAIDPLQPEIMFREAAGMDFEGRTVVAGPGMGSADAAVHLLGQVLALRAPLVVDADALNLGAARRELQEGLAAHGGQLILTPHPLEAARLLGVTASIVQADRLEHARELAMRFNCVVVLKGAGSVIGRPDGFVAVNTSGNPGLATGGSGDVLAGFCGALLAQGWPAWEAALGAVWLHGAAADWLVEDGNGPIGLTAGELPRAIRAVLNALVSST